MHRGAWAGKGESGLEGSGVRRGREETLADAVAAGDAPIYMSLVTLWTPSFQVLHSQPRYSFPLFFLHSLSDSLILFLRLSISILAVFRLAKLSICIKCATAAAATVAL